MEISAIWDTKPFHIENKYPARMNSNDYFWKDAAILRLKPETQLTCSTYMGRSNGRTSISRHPVCFLNVIFWDPTAITRSSPQYCQPQLVAVIQYASLASLSQHGLTIVLFFKPWPDFGKDAIVHSQVSSKHSETQGEWSRGRSYV